MAVRTTRLAVFSLASLFCIADALAQNDEPLVSIIPRARPGADIAYAAFPKADLRVDVPLILIPVHVTTPLGTSITNLRQENFRLFEDGAEQTIANFAKEDAPASVGLVFDTSGSMHNKINKSAEAAAAFFKIANPEDEFFLIEFNEKPKLSVPFTRDSDDVLHRIARAHTYGRTSLLDAIHLALVQMKQAHNLRKAIVIFSDGGDNRSRYNEREVREALLESDVQLYAMGIFGLDDSDKPSREELDGPRLLTELAAETGGKHFPVDNLEDLPKVCDRIGKELRNQYMLGYLSTNGDRDGRYRHIKVVLAPAQNATPMKPYYRQGYYAPTQ